MATYIRNDIIPSRIPDISMQEVVNADTQVLRGYEITPVDGYVLHDSGYDTTKIVADKITGEETEVVVFGYRRTTASCGYNYDFTTSAVTDGNGNTYKAYGTRKFFAVPESSVPADQIRNVINPPDTYGCKEVN